MRLTIVLLILLVLSGLAWVGFNTWNQGVESIDNLLPRGAEAAELEKRGAPENDIAGPRFEEPEQRADSGPLQGRVMGPDGGPVVGARVSLLRLLSAWPEWSHEQIEVGVYTDDEGRFLFQTPRGDDLMVEIFREDLATKRVPAPKQLSSLMIIMEHGFEVKGHVSQEERSVRVFLEPSSWSDNRAVSTRTDSLGFFRFTNVRAGLARLNVRHPFLPPATWPTVTVGSEEDLHLRFTGRSSQAVSGEVKRADSPDQPVVGAEVRVYPSTAWNSGLLEPFLAVTDEDGQFTVRGLGEGNLLVEVRHPEYSTTSRIAPRGSRDAPISFELLPKSEVRGTLSGADLTGIRISLVSGAGEIGWATVDAEGNFVFPELISSGRAILEIENGTWAFAESLARYLDISVREDGERTRVDQQMVAPSVLSGRVVDAKGNPLADVQVSTLRRRVALRSPERLLATTGPDGRYEFRGLVVGTVEVFMGSVELLFECEGYAPRYAAVAGSAEQAEIRLVKPGVIEGHVTRGGRALPGAIVFAGQGKRHETTVVTGPDGHYRLASLAPGSYRVKVRYSTLPVQLSDELAEVRSGEVSGPIDIDFPKGQIVRGFIRTDDGLPIAEASVLATGPFGARIITRTDRNGSFMLEVPNGASELQVVSPDFQIFVQAEIREGGDQGVIHLPMVPRASIVARVLGLPEGRPVVAGILRIEPLDDQEGWDDNERRQRDVPSRWIEMTNGELRIGDFPDGRSRLTLQCPGFIPHVQEVSLNRNESMVLQDIVLEPGARMRGLVTDTAGNAVAGAVVHLGEELDLFQYGARTSYRTDARGRFEIRGVSPLGKRLVIYAEGYATAVIDLEFPRDMMSRQPRSIVLQGAASITVRVKDAKGKPQSSGWVILVRDGVRLALSEPDEDGLVTFIARGAGTYSVALLGREGEGREVIITDESKGLEVELLVGNH